MIRLRVRAQAARLYLDEIADVHVLRQARAGAQARIRPDAAALADFGLLEVREGEHLAAGAERDVAQHAVRSDAHAVTQADPALEDAVDVDRYVAPALELAAHVDTLGVGETHARVHQPPRLAALVGALERRELGFGIDARDFHRIVHPDADHGHALLHRQRDEIGEVVLLLRIAIVDLAEPAAEPLAVQGHEAGVDLADRALGARRVLLLDDALHRAARVAHDAPVAPGIVYFRGHDRQAVACRLDQALQAVRAHQRHVTVQDQHVAAAVHVRHRLLHRVSGAELLGLQHPLDRRLRERGAHLLGAVPVHYHGLARLERARGVEHVREERATGNGMQDFGEVRTHALALAGGKHDHIEGHWGILANIGCRADRGPRNPPRARRSREHRPRVSAPHPASRVERRRRAARADTTSGVLRQLRLALGGAHALAAGARAAAVPGRSRGAGHRRCAGPAPDSGGNGAGARVFPQLGRPHVRAPLRLGVAPRAAGGSPGIEVPLVARGGATRRGARAALWRLCAHVPVSHTSGGARQHRLRLRARARLCARCGGRGARVRDPHSGAALVWIRPRGADRLRALGG